jgi:hypothetical protein
MPTREYYVGRKKTRCMTKSQLKWYLILSCAITIIGVTSVVVLILTKMDNQQLKHQLSNVEQVNVSKESELAVLRTLNPYQFKYSQILKSADVVRDLMPGWITRVYKAPKHIAELKNMMDMGAFVLDQSKFTLSSHESYGLESPENALYRLNGLVPSTMAGRFQIGVRLTFTLSNVKQADLQTKQASCYTRVDMNNRRVIEQKIKFLPGRKEQELLTGDAMVQQGIHPISVLLYCDEDSIYSGDDVQISLTFRDPGSRSFKTSSESVFHIYKPTSSKA